MDCDRWTLDDWFLIGITDRDPPSVMNPGTMTMCPELRRARLVALRAAAACATRRRRSRLQSAAAGGATVAEIRAEAGTPPRTSKADPLRGSRSADLRSKAQAAEAAKQFDQAAATLDAAGDHAEDPALWQWRAGIALAERRFADAIAHAQKSEAIGPKLGGLCVRNWLVAAARIGRRRTTASAAAARTCAASLPVPARIRM
ncbi:MAG: hypothetical protein IPH76_07525 [Xanthomonadales bacterium]|nr:hypothetical protein [Xanthomonadales bacterium]